MDGIIPKDNDIAFENIGFSYEKDEFKMENLSFDIDEKTMTALVGESGSGKTTITNLLLRFYDVQQGKITLGGVDIRDIPYDELLDRISIVMQNVRVDVVGHARERVAQGVPVEVGQRHPVDLPVDLRAHPLGRALRRPHHDHALQGA